MSDYFKNISSIEFEGEKSDLTMYLGWDKTIVSLPIKGKSE